MRRFDWLSEYLARLQDENVLVRHGYARKLAPAHVLEIDMEDWGKAGAEAASFGSRWAGIWGDQQGDEIIVNACLEHAGDYLVLRTVVPVATPVLPSHTPYFPAADRLERHAQDMLGLIFADHPDSRRWTRHQAWAEDRYPLRDDFPRDGGRPGETPPDGTYPFHKAQGTGVYEIPVGPVHAGIIEPGHFRFHAVGEEVLSLEQHLGYVHKGIEKIAVGRDAVSLARLAGRISGDSTVAHGWAACQAMERAVNFLVPARALAIRAILAERERIANHLGDIGAICNDVAFTFALYQFHRLRETWSRRNQHVFGHRFLMDQVIPGGVQRDIDTDMAQALIRDHAELREELEPLTDILTDHPSLEDRLLTTGYLSPATATRLGATGYVGKASGLGFDARKDNPYAPYNKLEVKVPVFEDGDVAARLQVRLDEISISLDIMDQLLQSLPPGDIAAAYEPIPDTEGLGIVDGWRGEILTYVRFDELGKVRRFFPRDPSWFTWPALELAVLGNIVADFPVVNKSINGSYSGHDL